MAKQAYISISDAAWRAMNNPEFEKLKTGYVGDSYRPGLKYEITGGVPPSAKLVTVIFVYEDESLPDVTDPLQTSPTVIMCKHFESEKVLQNG